MRVIGPVVGVFGEQRRQLGSDLEVHREVRAQDVVLHLLEDTIAIASRDLGQDLLVLPEHSQTECNQLSQLPTM